MRKASILLAMAALLGTACATTTGHLPGGTGPGTSSAGSVTLVRLQPSEAVQARPQPQPSLAPTVRVTLSPGGRPAPQSRPAQPSASAVPAANPTGRCISFPNPGPHHPEPMCAVP